LTETLDELQAAASNAAQESSQVVGADEARFIFSPKQYRRLAGDRALSARWRGDSSPPSARRDAHLTRAA
jgi:hypothetical protein